MNATNPEELAFWRKLAEGLQAGTAPARAVRDAAGEQDDTPIGSAGLRLAEHVEAGQTLSAAMADFPETFAPAVVRAVAAGEEAGDLDVRVGEIADAVEAGDPARLETPDVGRGPLADPAAVEAVRSLVASAVAARASDIHLDALEAGAGRVRFRVDGVLQEQPPLQSGRHPETVAAIKAMACLDVEEVRLPQDGRIMLDLDGRRYDLRVSVLPAVHGERVVCRILSREAVRLGLGQVGLGEARLAAVRRLCHLPSGMVIVNGPTGCGKTTLLYSMLLEIDRTVNCVMSVEDPVEYLLDGVAQLAIRPAVGWTFARATRAILRQDPDVVMVGELRDLEMMSLCVQVALTGHLVLTSLHAQTSVGAVRRLLDCGLEPFLINSTLRGVITPRLVRVLCPECKRPAEPKPHMLPPQARAYLDEMGGATFYEPVGCEHCKHMGYRGRTAIHEVLTIDDRIRQAVTRPPDMAALHNAALAAGMAPMLRDGLDKAAAGETSLAEVVRVVPPATMM